MKSIRFAVLASILALAVAGTSVARADDTGTTKAGASSTMKKPVHKKMAKKATKKKATKKKAATKKPAAAAQPKS